MIVHEVNVIVDSDVMDPSDKFSKGHMNKLRNRLNPLFNQEGLFDVDENNNSMIRFIDEVEPDIDTQGIQFRINEFFNERGLVLGSVNITNSVDDDVLVFQVLSPP